MKTFKQFAENNLNSKQILKDWNNKEPAEYALHLMKTFGDPDGIIEGMAVWYNQDGFKRIEIKDEYVMHTSPVPHYDYLYCYIDLAVPHELSSPLADCSESILLDHLKHEVGARCASLAANAVTLNFVMDVVANRTKPTKEEYERRIMKMHHDFDNKKIFKLDWWPDESHDTDPKNSYYAEKSKIDEHIVKVGSQYRLVSKKSGKNLGTYPTKSGALNRERQVEYFKSKK